MRFFFVLLLSLLIHSCEPTEFQKYKIVKVFDGDSFVVKNELNLYDTIRVFGIDCPERGQDYGNEAKRAAKKILKGELSLHILDIDRYGRKVANVYVVLDPGIDSISFQEKMLQEGNCWHYIRYSDSQEWEKLAREAKENRRGLWRNPEAVPPWEFRRSRKVKGQ